MRIDDCYTTRQLADLFGCSRQRVLKQVAEGKIPHVRLGMQWLYPKKIIDSMFADRIAAAREAAIAEASQGGLAL